MAGFDYDYIVIGSGFGGSVSALRLTEKGYKVLVVERGKRWRAKDYAKTTWEAAKSIWFPKLLMHGILGITVLRDVIIFHGAGVGGGSLVYANTHLVPHDAFFKDKKWADLSPDWKAELAPFYERARRMLGSVESPVLAHSDYVLAEYAEEIGRGHTFHRVDVGVFFGEPGEKVADPYFGGEGPERTGCILCGSCMVGCRHDAKNTLDKNYLYLAEKYGAEVLAERSVQDVRPLGAADGSDGYEVSTVSSTKPWRKAPRTFTAKGVVFAGGVLGTVPLLFRCKAGGSLPKLSDALGDFVRTNSEALVGASTRDPNLHLGKGIAITSGVHVDEDTHIEMVRYGDGGDAMSLLANMLVGAHPAVPRWLLLLLEVARKPLEFLRQSWPFGASRRFNILLVMQHLDNSMRLVMRRRWFSPFKAVLDSDYGDRPKPPTYMPQANDAAKALAAKMGGDPSSGLVEVLLNTSSTAHILGGCSIGATEKDGVIDKDHRVFGYENLYVCDGSVMPANLGVNPSLTITAMSERAMSKIPPKEGARVREPVVGVVPAPKIAGAPDPAPKRAG